MQEQLILLLGNDPADDVQWLPVGADGHALGTVQRGPLAAAAAMAGQRRVVAFVPTEQLILTDVSVPGVRGPRLRQAIPFALEDRVAADIESLHFASARPDDAGRVAVAVVERRLVDAWLAAFAAHAIQPAALVPDCLGLPWRDGETAVAVAADRVLLRDGRGAGFACERALFDAMLASRDAPPPLEVAVVAGSAPPDQLAGIPTVLLPDGLLPWLAPQAGEPPINLLQGPYAPKRRRELDLGRWRVPAALAAAWLVLALVAWTTGFVLAAREHADARAQVRAQFERLLPGEPWLGDDTVRRQLEQRLARSSAAGGEALHMLAAVGDGLSAVSGVQLGALNYRRGLLELTVTAQRAEQLDQLRDRIGAAAPFAVSIESASSRGEQVEGRMQVRTGS